MAAPPLLQDREEVVVLGDVEAALGGGRLAGEFGGELRGSEAAGEGVAEGFHDAGELRGRFVNEFEAEVV